RNPLTSIKLNIQKVFANKGLGDVEQSHLKISQEGIRQIEIFIKELLSFTRVTELNIDKFSMEMILDESIKMVLDSMELKKIRVIRNYEKGLPQVRVDADKMRQVFLNLLDNAHDAVSEGGIIEIGIFHVKDKSCHKVKVEISDNGCGIPEKDWDTVFEPYFTTKSSGFGLGLANARKIVERHKGTIRVKKKSGDGTIFEVLIPCEEER
ncbi:MAG: GHKL domain-containing protein, partial [Candidatus Aminicenantes bacterium]|nr:GHKL domain-containing protein [Candidatus Aminicenantes bacterium]